MTSSSIAGVALSVALLTARSFAQVPSSGLERLDFLLGGWDGVGGQPGATGGFVFTKGVQDHVVVRTNFSVSRRQAIGPRPDMMISW